MFAKNDLVVFGNEGVCKINDITTLDHEEAQQGKMYYILTAIDAPACKISVPVESEKSVMRSLITLEEAEQLIMEIPQLEEVRVTNERQREMAYRECMRTHECRQYARVMKTLYSRRKVRQASGKRTTSVDEKYMRLAEKALYSELAQLLGIDRDQVPDYINDRLKTAGYAV